MTTELDSGLDSRKERFFSWLDDAIDADAIGDNVVSYINNRPRLRMAAQRYFGSVRQALSEYGFYGMENTAVWNGGQVLNHFNTTYLIDDYGRLIFDEDFFYMKYDEYSALGGNLSELQIKKDLSRLLENERLQAFFDAFGVDAFGWLDYRPNAERPREFSEIAYVIRNRKEDRYTLAKLFGIRYRAYSVLNSSIQEIKEFQRLGHEFQALVKEVYDEITLARSEQTRIDDCIPDFISGFTWLDAKLSKSTATAATVQKYRKHTDWLIIVYAIDDEAKPVEGAIYKHISEYYPLITAELQRKIDAFIRKASEVRFGESNRLSDD